MRTVTKGQFCRIAAVLAEIGFSASEIIELGNRIIDMAAANSGRALVPAPVGRGELRHDGLPS